MSERLSLFLRKLKQQPVAASATAVVLLLGIAFMFRGSRLAELEQLLAEKESAWQRMELNLRRSHNLKSDLEQIQDATEEIESRLLRPAEVAINYNYFYGLERETGVHLTSLDQGGVIDPKGGVPGMPELGNFSAIAYTVGVEGRFSEVLRFLSNAAHGRFFLRISSLKLSSTGRGDGGLVNASLQCQVLGVRQ